MGQKFGQQGPIRYECFCIRIIWAVLTGWILWTRLWIGFKTQVLWHPILFNGTGFVVAMRPAEVKFWWQWLSFSTGMYYYHRAQQVCLGLFVKNISNSLLQWRFQFWSSHIPLIPGKGQERHELQEAGTSYIFRRYFGEHVHIILVMCIPKLKAVSLQQDVKLIQSPLEKVENELPSMIFKGSLVLNGPVSCSAISKESTFSGPEVREWKR